MKVLGVIPARIKSVRLPGKPLLPINGKSLLQRVWEQAKQAKSLTRVVIATDSEDIFELATLIGAEVRMTSDQHYTGTDRVAETAAILKYEGEDFDIVVNIQGDMPFIKPEIIDHVVDTLINSDKSYGMCTVARPITDIEEFLNTSVVKVVVDKDQGALLFSRAPIPFCRDGFDQENVTEKNPFGFKHLGLYVYRQDALNKLVTFEPERIESSEKLEQLRALLNGIKIKVPILSSKLIEPSIEVDTEEDRLRAEEYAKSVEKAEGEKIH